MKKLCKQLGRILTIGTTALIGSMFCAVIFFGGEIVAQTGENAEVLTYDEQKNSLLEEVYTDPEFMALIDTEQAKVTLQDLSQSFKRIQEQYDEFDEEREDLEEKYGDVQQSIDKILRETSKTKELVKDTLTKISLLSKKIETLRTNIEEIQADYEESKEDLASYTRFLYYLFNNYYGWGKGKSDVSLLIKSDNIAESLSTNDSVVILTKYLQTLMGAMKERQRKYTSIIMEINKAKLAYTQAGRVLKNDLDELAEQRNALYDLLAYLQTSKDLADSQASNLRGSQQSIAQQINQLRQLANTDGKAQEGTVAADLLKLPDVEESDKYFTWPILGAPYINRYFHDEVHYRTTGEKFSGVRFELPQRTEIYAPAPAVVYKVVNNDDLSLSWIILLHKHGYATFYSPMNEIFVEEGALVARGALIGLSGGQPGTNGAGLDSDGPRLDFSVMKNGEPVDPLSLLDISVYPEKSLIDEQYHNKYTKNLFERNVPLDEFDVMSGDTIAERRNAFLDTYASGSFADPALWVDAAYDTGIDSVFGMCIGFAETTFKNFKTKNNIGNVGNDDSGDTRTFASPMAGARALFSVFNNQYLNSYNTLNELSRFGNRDGFIYASSDYNWQKNIMKCLSAVYGYRVPEDFPFRRRQY